MLILVPVRHSRSLVKKGVIALKCIENYAIFFPLEPEIGRAHAQQHTNVWHTDVLKGYAFPILNR